jgi:hypothetical protein
LPRTPRGTLTLSPLLRRFVCCSRLNRNVCFAVGVEETKTTHLLDFSKVGGSLSEVGPTSIHLATTDRRSYYSDQEKKGPNAKPKAGD